MIRRIAGVILRPRTTLAELVHRPLWVDTWVVILIAVASCGAVLLPTEVGRQALVDERVRVIEAFGGRVDDARYAAVQQRPPYWMYFTSGGRLLLTPPVTIVVALACWLAVRSEAAAVTFTQVLSVVVHASVVLALGQMVATPLVYVRESLTSPLNLAAILPLMEEGTIQARVFGAIDLFALWWMSLLAIGLARLTRRRVGRYTVTLAAVYFGFAGILAGVMTAAGGF